MSHLSGEPVLAEDNAVLIKQPVWEDAGGWCTRDLSLPKPGAAVAEVDDGHGA